MNKTIISSFNDKCTLLQAINNIEYPYLHDIKISIGVLGDLHMYVYTSSNKKFTYNDIINWLSSYQCFTEPTGYTNIKFEPIKVSFTTQKTVSTVNSIFVLDNIINYSISTIQINDNQFLNETSTQEITENATTITDTIYRVV